MPWKAIVASRLSRSAAKSAVRRLSIQTKRTAETEDECRR